MLSTASFIVMVPSLGGGAILSALGGSDRLYVIGVIALLGIIVGIALVGCGVFIGVRRTTKKAVGPILGADGAYIVNVSIEDRQGNPVFDADLHDPEDLRYFVRVRFPEGHVDEFRADSHHLASLGEGMTGTVEFKGDRLVRFVQQREANG